METGIINQGQSLYITDLVEVDTLQRIQDTFSRMTGMSALTIDMDGNPVTRPSAFCDYCLKFTKASPEGLKRCMKCNMEGAQLSRDAGTAVTYTCHAGLINFSAPILADRVMVGSIAAGQVTVKPMDDEFVRKYADELGLDPEEYLNAAGVVPMVDELEIKRSAEFLYSLADIFSELAYHKYLAIQAGEEIQRAANMKGDFLANMSHEIRTPMNAVIGMAEMALREDLPPAAREHINQIKTSGSSLLTIINDILDFSKIEAGKMDIVWVEYDPLSLVNDIVNIISTRVGDKDLELIIDLDLNLPRMIFGDSNRIKQVVINLANNAVKFTKKGMVAIHIACSPIKDKQLTFSFAVEDTGIGIKREDMSKLFQSFQQLDSKRNRNIEGNGLGLAISSRLVSLMNGSHINVESEYNRGSTFSFTLPQMVLDESERIKVEGIFDCVIVDEVSNPYISYQLQRDASALGVRVVKPATQEIMDELCSREGIRIFYFMEEDDYNEKCKRYIVSHPSVKVVMLIPYNARENVDDPDNVIRVRKPLYSLILAKLLMGEELHETKEEDDEDIYDFIAPDAKVLVVDDNQVNLTVSSGLLEPLQMQIDTALSGMEAIELIGLKHYDIVFMDHMMPEMDGVETTHVIRRMFPEYNDVPIIALTGNVMDDMRKMFLTEGMNDFVAKPIEIKILVEKVRQYLHPDKIIKNTDGTGAAKRTKKEAIVVGDLDTETAIRNLGSEKLFWTILKDYYDMIDQKSAQIEAHFEEKDYHAYTIEVHALKSSSRQIGAMALSNLAADMEKAGNDQDKKKIAAHTPELLEMYRAYKAVFAPFVEADEPAAAPSKAVDSGTLLELLEQMLSASFELDMDRMEEISGSLSGYRYDEVQQPLYEALYEAVRNMDVDSVESIIEKWRKILI